MSMPHWELPVRRLLILIGVITLVLVVVATRYDLRSPDVAALTATR